MEPFQMVILISRDAFDVTVINNRKISADSYRGLDLKNWRQVPVNSSFF